MPSRPKITSYRVIPPRMRILYSKSDEPMSGQRYLQAMDQQAVEARDKYAYEPRRGDLVSSVFAQQINQHADESRELANLVVARHSLAYQHLRDIRHRRDKLCERLPFRPSGPGFQDDHTLTEVERTLFDLEKQERLVETKLWSDLLDLRQTLSTKRGEYRAVLGRIQHLTGGDFTNNYFLNPSHNEPMIREPTSESPISGVVASGTSGGGGVYGIWE